MMERLSKRRMTKTGALLQLATVCLLQAALVLPSFTLARPTTVHAVCQGDHEKCGCSPARVAAGTCCCVISTLPPCCKKKALEKAKLQAIRLAQPPCGKDELVISQEFSPFVPARFTPPLQFPVAWHYPPCPAATPTERTLRPPVPPPELTLHS